MAESDFQVVFDGQLVDGAEPAQVRANVAKLFKMEVTKVEPLFSGRRTVVKGGVDEATARKYRTAFERAGAVATIVGPSGVKSSTAAPSAMSPAASTARSNTEAPTRVEIAEASRAPPPLITRGLPSAPVGMTMAEPGAPLIDKRSTVAAPVIDTSHLTLSEAGVNLVEPKKVEAPEFDLSAFELAPLGTALGDPTQKGTDAGRSVKRRP